MRKSIGLIAGLVVLMTAHTLLAEWVEDREMNFKINVPRSWQKNILRDGSDKIHVFLSPDQNLAIRIRAFKVARNTGLDLIASLFKTRILGECEQLAFMDAVVNGYSGKIGAYRGMYNGIKVGAGAFFTIQDGIAYIVWSLTPLDKFQSRVKESDAITNTFTLLRDESGSTFTFQSSELGYRIEYPRNWVYTQTKPNIIIFSGAEGTPAYYATVNIQNLASTRMGGRFNTVDDVINHYQGQMLSGASNVTMSKPESFTFESGGKQITGKVFEITYTRDKENFKQLLVIFPRFDQRLFYSFNYTAPVKDYDTYRPIATEMLNTWVIE